MPDKRTDNSPARLPFATVVASIMGVWFCYFLLITLRGELLGLESTDEMFWRRVLTTAAGIAITFGLWLILRAFDSRPLWMKIAAALVFAAPAALLTAQVNRVVFEDMQAAMDARLLSEFAAAQGLDEEALASAAAAENAADPMSAAYWQRIADVALSRYFLLLAWSALYIALLTGERARVAERREQQFRNAAKAAELRSLRYQVNPHFLFNTLNSLSALVLTGRKDAAERMIQMLSRFYRRSLADDTTADVPLAEEIALQRLYLDIESVRFPLRLLARYEVPAELEDVLVPGMILQPLIENSVKHAVAPQAGQVTITLAAREEYGRLVVSVSDDGPGIATHDDTRPGFGIGLSNVRERLEARFGDEATIVSGPVPGGFATHLRLPILRGEHRREAAE